MEREGERKREREKRMKGGKERRDLLYRAGERVFAGRVGTLNTGGRGGPDAMHARVRGRSGGEVEDERAVGLSRSFS